jgi:hypothetical protein
MCKSLKSQRRNISSYPLINLFNQRSIKILYVKKHTKIKHCTKNPIYVLLEIKLRGLVPNSYIHVSMSDLYFPRTSLPIWLQQNRQTDTETI